MELLKSAPGAAGQQEPAQPPSVDDVCAEIRQAVAKLDPYTDSIALSYHLSQFVDLFARLVKDDQMLNNVLEQLNEAALADNKFAVKMATGFASYRLSSFVEWETKIRNAIIGTLQRNFLAIERLKQTDMQSFYNSVTLLGEYYNRKRVLNGQRINILGVSLLLLLTSELEQEITKCIGAQQQQGAYQMDVEFAKLLLEQITLNGAVAKEEHKKEIADLMFTIRKALITVPNLCARTKAFLLMALDLYHSNLPEDLFEKLYHKYLKEPTQETMTRTRNGETVETVLTEQPCESKQPVAKNGEARVARTEEKTSSQAAVPPKTTGVRANSISHGSAAKTPSPQNTRTTHDKENKRRPSSRTWAVPDKKTPASSQPSKRNVRVSDDGKMVATINAPNSPIKNTPPTSPTVGSLRAERSPAKKGLSPRLERLAALPKITITCSTPSPKRQVNPPAISPRAVLGVATAKQQQQQQHPNPRHPPKSPIRPTTPKSVPEVQKSTEGNVRSANVETKSNPCKAQRAEAPITPSSEHTKQDVNHHENGTNSSKSSPPKDSTNHASNGGGLTHDKDPILNASIGKAGETLARENGTSASYGTTHTMGKEEVEKGERPQEAPETAAKSKGKSYQREEDMENLSWDAMMALEDDSPQKLNPHTKSFLSFLADK